MPLGAWYSRLWKDHSYIVVNRNRLRSMQESVNSKCTLYKCLLLLLLQPSPRRSSAVSYRVITQLSGRGGEPSTPELDRFSRSLAAYTLWSTLSTRTTPVTPYWKSFVVSSSIESFLIFRSLSRVASTSISSEWRRKCPSPSQCHMNGSNRIFAFLFSQTTKFWTWPNDLLLDVEDAVSTQVKGM